MCMLENVTDEEGAWKFLDVLLQKNAANNMDGVREPRANFTESGSEIDIFSRNQKREFEIFGIHWRKAT